MLTHILLLMIGLKLNMGTAYYVTLAIAFLINTISVMVKIAIKAQNIK